MFQASFHISQRDLRKLLRGKKSGKKNTSKQPLQGEPKKSPSSRLPRPVQSETPCRRKPKKFTADIVAASVSFVPVTAAVSSPSFGDVLQMNANNLSLTLGSVVTVLSYIYEKNSEPGVCRRALDGFFKCAKIAAHYAMSDVLDNLIVSLTKFTMLVTTTETAENFKIMYGANNKALLATRAVFSLHLLQDSKFFLTESLQELVKYLIAGSVMDNKDTNDMAMTSEHDALFYLELMTRITIANIDRVGLISASARTLDMQFHLERAVSSLQFYIMMTKLNS